MKICPKCGRKFERLLAVSRIDNKTKIVKGIEEQYLIAEKISDGFKWKYAEDVRKFDDMLLQVPQEYWIQ